MGDTLIEIMEIPLGLSSYSGVTDRQREAPTYPSHCRIFDSRAIPRIEKRWKERCASTKEIPLELQKQFGA